MVIGCHYHCNILNIHEDPIEISLMHTGRVRRKRRERAKQPLRGSLVSSAFPARRSNMNAWGPFRVSDDGTRKHDFFSVS